MACPRPGQFLALLTSEPETGGLFRKVKHHHPEKKDYRRKCPIEVSALNACRTDCGTPVKDNSEVKYCRKCPSTESRASSPDTVEDCCRIGQNNSANGPSPDRGNSPRNRRSPRASHRRSAPIRHRVKHEISPRRNRSPSPCQNHQTKRKKKKKRRKKYVNEPPEPLTPQEQLFSQPEFTRLQLSKQNLDLLNEMMERYGFNPLDPHYNCVHVNAAAIQAMNEKLNRLVNGLEMQNIMLRCLKVAMNRQKERNSVHTDPSHVRGKGHVPWECTQSPRRVTSYSQSPYLISCPPTARSGGRKRR